MSKSTKWDYAFALEFVDDIYRDALKKEEKDRRKWQALSKKAEKLIATLKPDHPQSFSDYDFKCLVTFILWDQPDQARRAHKYGLLKMGNLEIRRISGESTKPKS